MKKSFVELLAKEELLMEKLLMLNNGASYGQVLFLAGGSASGKGFALANFLEGSKFKVFDVDELKKAFITLAQIKKEYAWAKDLSLKNPDDVMTLHEFITKKKIMQSLLRTLLERGTRSSEEYLPNLCFDVTLKDVSKLTTILPLLSAAGYKSTNIHLVWILTNYVLALKNNQNRGSQPGGRLVPAEIVVQSHVGAAETMVDLIRNGLPKGIDGTVAVVLNNKDQTVFYSDKSGTPIRPSDGTKPPIIKDFTYLVVKRSGSSFISDHGIQEQLWNWIRSNAPETALQKVLDAMPGQGNTP